MCIRDRTPSEQPCACLWHDPLHPVRLRSKHQCWPVSYTHLDVYKRQVHTLSSLTYSREFETEADRGAVEDLAPELVGLQAFTFNGDKQREVGTTIEFEAKEPVKLLVGYFCLLYTSTVR